MWKSDIVKYRKPLDPGYAQRGQRGTEANIGKLQSAFRTIGKRLEA